MPDTKTTKCPACGFEAHNAQEEVKHMTEEHPDVVYKRLKKAGFRLIDGNWVDTLTDGT